MEEAAGTAASVSRHSAAAAVLLLLLLLLLAPCEASVVRVEWSRSNPLLMTGEPVRVNQDVEMSGHDQAQFVCPLDRSQPAFSVFLVDQQDFQACSLLKPSTRYRKIAECGPSEQAPILISFRQFSPLPGGLEFVPGETYYFLSVNQISGTQSSQHQKQQQQQQYQQQQQQNLQEEQEQQLYQCDSSLRISFLIGSPSSRSRVNLPRGPGHEDSLLQSLESPAASAKLKSSSSSAALLLQYGAMSKPKRTAGPELVGPYTDQPASGSACPEFASCLPLLYLLIQLF